MPAVVSPACGSLWVDVRVTGARPSIGAAAAGFLVMNRTEKRQINSSIGGLKLAVDDANQEPAA
jgi:hypothetical protein